MSFQPNYQLTQEKIKFTQYTEDKTAGLALFYNVALDRMNNLVAQYEGVKSIDLSTHKTPFKPSTYQHLQVYLWKENVSSSFANLKKIDITLIHQFINKLIDLRNYQSHYYHDPQALVFPKELKDFILTRLDWAKNQLFYKFENFKEYILELEHDSKPIKNRNGEIIGEDVYRHFEYFDDNGKILKEGKNFFLSFFLLKGEMNKFLKKRERCKRDNGKRYQVKTNILTYYCHRDGSNRFFLNAKKDFINDNERLSRQFNSILNYLKSKPVAHYKYLPPTKLPTLRSTTEIEHIRAEREHESSNDNDKIIVRRRNKFLDISTRYFMDRKLLGNTDVTPIRWHVEKIENELIEKKEAENYATELSKVYFKKKTYWKENFVNGYFPVYTNKHVKFKLDNDDEYAIGQREIKNWLYYLIDKTNNISYEDTIQAIKAYGFQYTSAMNELMDKHSITFENYPLIFDKGIDSVIVSEMHKKIIENQQFDLDEYKQKIIKAIDVEINRLNKHLEQEDYTRNKKNRIILNCFNWYLPIEAKLKPSEINKLSIYNFVSENRFLKEETRNSIISEIDYKLRKATEKTYQLLTSSLTLNDLFKNIISNKITSLKREKESLHTYTKKDCHRIAASLGVTLPGINESRSEKNRLTELKETIRKKPILISNGLFRRAFDRQGAKKTVSGSILKHPIWNSFLIEDYYILSNQDEFVNHEDGKMDISTDVLHAVSENYDQLFKEHALSQGKKFEHLVNGFVGLFPDPTHVDRKEVADAINLNRKLMEIKIQDNLLAQILFEYHNFVRPLKTYNNIAELQETEYELKIEGHKSIMLKYKQLDDLATHWNVKRIGELFSNNSYWSEEVQKKLEEKTPKSDQQKILIQMDKVVMDSYKFIKTVLEVEAKYLKIQLPHGFEQFKADSKVIIKKRQMKRGISESKVDYGMDRIEFGAIIRKLKDMDQNKEDFYVKLRNNALHSNIPENNIKYGDHSEILIDWAELPKPEEKDANKYRKQNKG